MDILNTIFSSSLDFFNSFFSNYGISVIVVTIIFKLLLAPLNFKQYVTSNLIELIDKEIASTKTPIASKEKDKIELNKERKEIYKRYSITKSGSCMFSLISLIVQTILIFSFYSVIRNNPGISSDSLLWFELGKTDTTFILPIFSGVITMTYFYINSKNHSNKKLSYIVGGIITALTIILGFSLPAIIYIYWTTSNLFTILLVIFSHGYASKIYMHRSPLTIN
ncbi:membrane protein insertase YidC [Metabacillus sp. SLBN-84]